MSFSVCSDELLNFPLLPIVGDMKEYLTAPHKFVLIPAIVASKGKQECFQFVVPVNEAQKLWSPRSMDTLLEIGTCTSEIERASFRHGTREGLLSPRRCGRTRNRSHSVPPLRTYSPQFRNSVLETRSPAATD